MKPQVLLLALLFVVFSCDTTEPPLPPPPPPAYVRSIDLSVVETGLTDAYLRVRFLDTAQTRAFRLHRNGQPVLTISPAPMDTVLLQDSLGIHSTHNYRAYRLRDTLVIDSSLSVSLTTLDTTSHNFTFQSFQFGQHSSSVFNDVAIIDENNIWAVGEVYLRDSTGQDDPILYNLARWDGTKWSLIRVNFPGACGQPATAPEATRAVFAFGSDDVWIASAGLIARWNGSSFTILCIPPEILPGSINKIWGENSNSVYVIGSLGTIVYWNGSTWQRIESGTTLKIYDIFGARDPERNEEEIYAVAADQFVSFDRRIMKVTPEGVTVISDSGISYSLQGVWFKPAHRYWVVGSGMYTKRSIDASGRWEPLHPGLTPYYIYAIRGENVNEVTACGSFGELLHYNGCTWSSFRSLVGLSQGEYIEVNIKGGMIAAVGYDSPRAVIVLGRR